MDDQDSAPAQPAVDTGVGDDVVTITAPAHTLNWAMVGFVALAVWWLYSNMSADEDYDED